MKSLSTLGGGSWEGQEGILAIPGLDGGFLHDQYADFESVTWTSLGSTPATRRYKGRCCRINTHEVAIYSGGGFGKAERGFWRSQDSMADSSTTASPIMDLSPGRHWARRQLHGCIRDVTVASIPMKSLHSLGGGPRQAQRGCWRSQDSMADSSTTASPIMDLSPGRHWARRQLHPGIGAVAIVSTFMKWLDSLGGGPRKAQRGCGRSRSPMADSSTPGGLIADLMACRRWSQRQLYAGIRYVSIASILKRLLFTLPGVLGRQKG